jgi:hypothetical protein
MNSSSRSIFIYACPNRADEREETDRREHDFIYRFSSLRWVLTCFVLFQPPTKTSSRTRHKHATLKMKIFLWIPLYTVALALTSLPFTAADGPFLRGGEDDGADGLVRHLTKPNPIVVLVGNVSSSADGKGVGLLRQREEAAQPVPVNNLHEEDEAYWFRVMKDMTMSVEPSPSDILDGLWTTRGYGLVLNVTNGEIALMEETDISCILVVVGPVDSLSELTGIIDYQVDGDVVTWTGGASPIIADRVDATQGACDNGLTLVAGNVGYMRDPLLDFDILAKTFDEHYAFFDLRGINWNELTTAARMNLTKNSTDDELLKAFASILLPLDDGHVGLFAGNVTVESKPGEIEMQFEDEFEQQQDMNISDFEQYFEIQFSTIIQIIDTYMDGGLNGESGGLRWGRFNGTGKPVGYMYIPDFLPEDEDAFVEELNEAFFSLADTESIVFDVRTNPGGFDTLALLVASHFFSERTLAFTKRAVDGDGYTDPFEAYVEPGSGPTYDGQVIVMISGSTVSAAEVFTLTMAQLPQTTLLGHNTSGALSDLLKRTLPNGWIFTLSNEEYAAPDGVIYEAVGIPPKILPDANLFPLSEREAFIDSWLELALETARQ